MKKERCTAPLLRRNCEAFNQAGFLTYGSLYLPRLPEKTVFFRPGGVTHRSSLCGVQFVRLRASAHVPWQNKKSSFFKPVA